MLFQQKAPKIEFHRVSLFLEYMPTYDRIASNCNLDKDIFAKNKTS